MVRLPDFKAGDLVVACGSQTSGVKNGNIGIVTKVEMISRNYYIYWVRFGKKEVDTPMWEAEIEIFKGKR
jgi:hypothetical protein